MENRKRFLKLVEWSEEDQCFVGSIPGWIGPCCHGDDESQVYQELGKILEEWITIYEQSGTPLPEATAGKTYSGKFVLRTGEELHKALTLRATQAGKSLNNYCTQVLKFAVMEPQEKYE